MPTREEVLADLLRRKRMNPDDPAFSETVAQRLSGPVDPKYARHVRLTDGSGELDEGVEINYRGIYHPEDQPEGTIPGTRIPSYPGDVMALHTANTPSVWAHEYRHKNYPELTENMNRVVDMISAKDDWEVDDVVRLWANRNREDIPSDAIPDVMRLMKRVKMGRIPKVEQVVDSELKRLGIDMDVDEFIETSQMAKFGDDVEELEEYNEGLSERNTARKAGEDESLMDTLRRVADRFRAD